MPPPPADASRTHPLFYLDERSLRSPDDQDDGYTDADEGYTPPVSPPLLAALNLGPSSLELAPPLPPLPRSATPPPRRHSRTPSHSRARARSLSGSIADAHTPASPTPGGTPGRTTPALAHFPHQAAGQPAPSPSAWPSRPSTARSSGLLSPGGSAADLAHLRRTPPAHLASASSASIVRDSLAGPPPLRRARTAPDGEKLPRAGSGGGGVGTPLLQRRATVARAKSTRLAEGTVLPKPWLERKDGVARAGYWITWAGVFTGAVCAALLCFFGLRGVPKLGNVCLVLQDDFDTLDTDHVWTREVDLGGFGNGEFEMTTASANNSFVQDGILYLVPTLTADVIGAAAVFDGHTFNLTGCTNANQSACGAVSNATTHTVINPVQSARLTTRTSHSIQFGRVEIRAKLPKGDWLWPALWMLPVNSTYGPWPLSGEIDIMESRGNDIPYPDQGRNYVRSSLNWGPSALLNAVAKTYGWWTQRRATYADGFHTYTLEWADNFMRIYVDTRLHRMLDLRFNEPFFARGDFPPTVFNSTQGQEVVVQNPWASAGNAAPFDQQFYLIMDVAVGGTNGWFPDRAGNKPWLDGSLDAMYDFAKAQDTWYSTWPADPTERGMAIDYVKMWQRC